MTKTLAMLAGLACPLQAALLAHVHTDRGTVDVELQFNTAPRAVANFITLAQGTRPWVDSRTGDVRTEPFYDGTRIHRTNNDSSFKIAQGGSKKGDGSDDPGYSFRDEFPPGGPTHVPYMFSMANAGPNTNGSQFFFTGDMAHPGYDNRYTIVGSVTAPASRLIVDEMIAAGPNATTINSITFERTDPAALAFDEHAQGLPVVSALAGSLSVVPGTSVTWNAATTLAPGNQLRIYRSQDLATWALHSSLFLGNNGPSLNNALIDNASLPSAIYRLTGTDYVDDQTISSLASATFDVRLSGFVILYEFDATGSGGTVTVTSPDPEVPSESGPFVLNPQTTKPYSTSPYRSVIEVDNMTTVQPRYLRFTAYSDTFTPGQSAGRLRVDELIFGAFPQFLGNGTHTLSN